MDKIISNIDLIIVSLLFVLFLSVLLNLWSKRELNKIEQDIKSYELELKKREYENQMQHQYNRDLSPLTWDKDNGFNRAPTLNEALRFKIDEQGDEVRSKLANGESLDSIK